MASTSEATSIRALPVAPPKKRRPKVKGVEDYLRGAWSTDKYGNPVPPPVIDEFIDWLCDPYRNTEMSQAQWAELHDVAAETLSRWLRDPRVKELLEKRYEVLNAHPERVQRVVDAVFERACLGDVKAASLYLQYVDKLTPKRIVIHEARELASLNDDQFRQELSRAMQLLDSKAGRMSLGPVIDVEEPHAVDDQGREAQVEARRWHPSQGQDVDADGERHPG